MRRLIVGIILCVLAFWGTVTSGHCADADVSDEYPFNITTTDMAAGTEFSFKISASGSFWVDWGDGSAVQIITRTDTTNTSYSHTYTTAGVYTIKFGGRATGYSTSRIAAISFNVNTYIAGISGSLGAIFPTLDTNNGQIPRFYQTFQGCTGLTQIPADLFSGVTGSTNDMFNCTFTGCSNLVGPIPAGLFSGVTGNADSMFSQTFNGCTGLTGPIPGDLFSGVTGSADSMFWGTFWNCGKLSGPIPVGLFRGVTGSANTMFQSTFEGCSKLSGEIPADLFSGVTGSAYNMFAGTFNGCSKLSGSIPAGLFRGVTGSANTMFRDTFRACSGLTGPIPAGLFRGVTGSANSMFRDTFRACSGLTGYVPAGMFPDNTTGASEMYTNTFSGASKMDTSCPANMYDTPPVGAESWTVAVCNPCPDGTVSPAGADEAADCGKILHIGDEKMYLRSVKKTSPALAVGVGDKTFYANMSTVEHNLTAGSRRFLKSDYKNSIYYIYDDTAENR